MAPNPTAVLSSLLSSSTIDDHEERLKQANDDLKRDKTNRDALYNRLVALIKLDRFDDALRALNDGGDKLGTQCALEKSYALYKTGQLEEAAKVVRETNEDSRGLKHVAAQVAYRSERFEDAARIYKELSGQSGAVEGEENDLRINISATEAQLEWQGNGEKIERSSRKPGREDLEAFETAYNASCGYLARGDLGPGGLLLKRARDLCEALDDLSDDEKKTEILPIMVQQVYVLIRMGKLEEAEVLQKMIHITDIPEAPTRVVAQNNALALVKHENPYLAQRMFESIPGVAKTEKLFKYQESIMWRNRYTIDLQAMKYDGVARSTTKVLSHNSSPTTSPFLNSISVFKAAASMKGDNNKASLKLILPLLEKRPADIGLMLTITQLYLLTNNAGPAVTLLESFFKRLEESATPADQDVLYAPGLVALLVSLYRLQGRKAPIQEVLGKAASYWWRKPKPSEGLLRAAALALLDSSKPEDLSAAGEIFASLGKQDPTDRLVISGFVASNAIKNISVDQSKFDKLTPVERLVSGIDASALEEAGIASLPTTIPDAGRKRPVSLEKEKVANKKIRKSKMPKEFEEGKIMDPERWLPMKDRSTYRPKGKKSKKKALDATQGGVVKEEESLELVGGAGAVKVEKAPLGVGKAKKKKGKK